MSLDDIIIFLGAVALVFAAGLVLRYFIGKDQSDLDAMTPEEREEHDALRRHG